MQQVTFQTIPSEILFSIAKDFLAAEDVLALLSVCKAFHATLNLSESLWKALAIRRTAIGYLAEGRTWRSECFNKDFFNQCPHLSDMTNKERFTDVVNRFHVMQRSIQYKTTSCTSCPIPMPDLWLCLATGCRHAGCGRTKNEHAKRHHESTQHPLCLKLNTLEIWCYTCIRWVGCPSPGNPGEVALTRALATACAAPFDGIRGEYEAWHDRRHAERGMYKIDAGDRLFFLSMSFLMQWRDFLMSEEGPAVRIDNRSLLGMDGRFNIDLIPFSQFGIVSEVTWRQLMASYGGGPELCEEDLPRESKLYSMVQEAKSRIVEQVQKEAVMNLERSRYEVYCKWRAEERRVEKEKRSLLEAVESAKGRKASVVDISVSLNPEHKGNLETALYHPSASAASSSSTKL
ncbi:hypothetical protein BC830DRAFT_275921 [Chytriomyces sp. MP71]|nr:hypothetical protein BC830DRAFT_275921 [Chytriomyces sp. MP71]